MSDIVERLRAITGQAGDHGDVQLCDAAADEIERLRLTDAERDAVKATIRDLEGGANFNEQRFWPTLAGQLRERSATLRGLLERTAKLSESDKPGQLRLNCATGSV